MPAMLVLASALAATFAAANAVDQANTGLVTHWGANTVQDLHREYHNIFKYGNRNAASHRWSTFLLQRSHLLSAEKLTYFFSGFCAVSGSPVGPHDYNRYLLRLDKVSGGKHTCFMHYCCWPCVCDTQDFIKVDTKTVQTKEGMKQFHFAVLGNPCEHEEEMSKPFVQPFDRRQTTIRREAAEVRCDAQGNLEGATLSDHGYIIINMVFDVPDGVHSNSALQVEGAHSPTPGRITEIDGVKFQDEREYAPQCDQRARAGYNSGMGEIFRRVAAITPVPVKPPALAAKAGYYEN